ncbi:Crp/Fnr family transcriptional regulator [Thermosinus carboxydivorans]|uniref:Crp/Fnr family transcriptional regulator n=1 Tax=Thermosinus carboxydivorans TaxID=261685 RepID=UPI0002D97AEF|nr:Crp/Fnr family transcriptional regulator [Thermosinus carboxydivorans]
MKEFQEHRFSKKAILYSPNNEKNLVFLVKSGRVRVYLAYEDKEFTLSILEAGDIYSTHTRAFTQAMENTTILVTDVRNFKKIIAEIPAFGLNMVNVLGDLLKNSITIINGLVFKDTHLRLVEFLVQAAKDRGVTVEQGIKLELGLTTEEIALILGATPKTHFKNLCQLLRIETKRSQGLLYRFFIVGICKEGFTFKLILSNYIFKVYFNSCVL